MAEVLTKDEILAMVDLEIQPVFIPEWKNKCIYVKGLTGTERDEFEESVYLSKSGGDSGNNFKNFRAKLVAMTACDENGNRLFTLDDTEALGKKSAAALERIYKVAEALSGFRKKDVDELTKNS